jgi:hypothetical protein
MDIQTRTTDEAPPNLEAAAGTEVITDIRMIADDGMQVMETTLQNAAEKDLLRQFWQLVQPHDVFYGRNISSSVASLRRASWKLDLIPSPGVDLRAIYEHSTVDMRGQEPSSGDAGYRSAGALACLLGLPGNGPGAKGRRVP